MAAQSPKMLRLFQRRAQRATRCRGRDRGHGPGGLVAHHLRAWIAYRGGTSRLHDWRTRSGREVDFVEYGSEGFTALEVKRSRTVHSRDVRGLQAFRADYPEAELALLHRGDEALVIDGIRCLPVKAFLRGVHPARPLLGRGEGNV